MLSLFFSKQMVIPGDQGPIHEEEGLFRIKDLKSGSALKKVTEDNDSNIVADSDEDDDKLNGKRQKNEKFSREKGKLDKSGLFYKNSDSEDEQSDDESSEDGYLLEEDETDEKGPVTSTGHVNDDEYVKHPLLVDLEDGATRKERRAQVSTLLHVAMLVASFCLNFLFLLSCGSTRTFLKGSMTTKTLKTPMSKLPFLLLRKKGGRSWRNHKSPHLNQVILLSEFIFLWLWLTTKSLIPAANKSDSDDSDDDGSSSDSSDYTMDQPNKEVTVKGKLEVVSKVYILFNV